MTEHHHHLEGHHNHKEEGVLEEAMAQSCYCCDRRSSGITLPLTIFVSALLIAGSILYANKLTNRKLEILGAVAQNSATVAPGTQANQPAAPTGPVDVAGRADEPVKGSKDAKVTIVEFGDFQCPYCQNFFKDTLPQIKSQYIDTGKAKLIFRHFPLPFHANAEISGVAAECANQQGQFWEYHDLLYTNGSGDGTNLDAASLKKYADQLGLNKGTLGFAKNKFNQCLDSKATLDIVKKDNAEGTKDGVSGTPTFYINGIQLVGAQPFTAFQAAIDKALAE